MGLPADIESTGPVVTLTELAAGACVPTMPRLSGDVYIRPYAQLCHSADVYQRELVGKRLISVKKFSSMLESFSHWRDVNP